MVLLSIYATGAIVTTLMAWCADMATEGWRELIWGGLLWPVVIPVLVLLRVAEAMIGDRTP